MKRSGFTMIELIFVIVILGILAAVAIPRLAATRDDAKISKGASEVSTFIGDMGSFYTANGEWNQTSMPNITNVTTTLGTGTMTYGTVASIVINGVNCVDFNGTSDGNLTIANTTGVTDTVCLGVQTTITANGLIKTNRYGGKRVTY